MNAIQFIKEHGVEKAREVVDGAPRRANHYCADNYWSWDGIILKRSAGDGFFIHSIWGASAEWVSKAIDLSDLKRLVESVDIISKFDSVQEAKDAIANAPEGATEFRKLSCSTRYIKVGPRFFEYWDGFNWCRPTVPFTDETHILRFTQLSRLEQAIADYKSIYSDNDMGDDSHIENHVSPNCKVGVK